MSSRVQKGSQRFTPVVKPRGRPGEGTSSVSRKPPSARGSTVETFRAQSSQPAREQSQFIRLASASVAPESSTSEQRDGFASVQKPVSIRGTRSNKPPSSRSVGGTGHTTRAVEASSETIAIFSDAAPGQPLAAHDVNTSQQTAVASSSSQVVSGSEPTLHSLLQSIQSNGVIITEPAGASHHPTQFATGDPQNAAMPVVDGLEQGSRNGLASTVQSGTNTAVGVKQDDRAVEERMTRKRRASTRPGRTSEVTQADVQEDNKEHTLRRTKRMRKPTQRPDTINQADAIADEESSETKVQARQRRSRRSSSSTPARGRRGRKSTSVTLFDPDADPGEELDPTVVTMAAICDDTGQGRVSSKAALIQRNHEAWKAANKQKRERMRLIMEAKKYGRKEDENGGPVETSQAEKKDDSDADGSRAATPVEAPTVEGANGFNYRVALPVNRFSAQVRIGPNGETIIDEESLFVERTENADDGTDSYQHVEESDQTKFTNSATYGRKLRGSRWSAEETELFYDALSQFGENYELISYVIPGRDRKACKAKFKAEDKKNPNRITYCLKNRTPYDIETLSRLTGKDFSGPTPEIVAPVKPCMVDEPKQPHSEVESSTQKPRKKSKTPGLPDDVEVVGDIEAFDGKESDD